MDGISSLNTEYIKCIDLLGKIEQHEQKLQALPIDDSRLQELQRLFQIREITDQISSFPALDDNQKQLCVIVDNCYNYLKCVEEYQNALISTIDTHKPVDTSIGEILKHSFITFQNSKDLYKDKYGFSIDSLSDMRSAVLSNLNAFKERVLIGIEDIKKEAESIISKKESLSMKIEMQVKDEDDLPVRMPLARSITGTIPCELLCDIGVTNDYHSIDVDLKDQGNVLIETTYEQTLDTELDSFVLAYILKFIESFPLGMANVHIFDRNPNRYNQRLCSIFKEGSYSERAKKTVSLYNYDSLSQLSEVTSVIVDDVFKKTSYECPDLYSIYDVDKTDPFTLIVLRDGLLDQNSFGSTVLDMINSLTKPDESGHVCGIRFLIIDDSDSHKQGTNENVEYLVNSIKNNCSIHLSYSNGKFYNNGEPVEVLHIDYPLDKYVHYRATQLAEAITGLEKQYVSVSEISQPSVKDPNDSIYRIPIGKSGNGIVEIPLSCKDDNGTVDGQCIGYMVIGQSGSGKSSFFHSVVINGCLQYSPLDLQFWLLDFKYGGASSKYRHSQIPHVRIVSENNKIDDALCLFQMINDEMERRNKLINDLLVDNIIDYNSAVEPARKLPRIIVLIDEVQEIFRDDNAAEIQRMISSISVRMRSVGMHFIMVAQNLCEGKSYMLKEAFLPSATGRICFRVSENMPRESGFDESFIQRKEEINTLSTGEAYVGWGKDTIKKVRMAYASQEDMNNKLFKAIKEKYPEYDYLKPMVIGSKKRLSITTALQDDVMSYSDAIKLTNSSNNIFSAIVGEDSYRLKPLSFQFTPYKNSSLLLLGDDKSISSSLCTSIALSLIRQKAEIHIFNADKQRSQYDGEPKSHPFMYLCGCVKESQDCAFPHSLSEFSDVVRSFYAEYLKRVENNQMSDLDEIPTYSSRFLIVNDLFGIQRFTDDDAIEIQSNDAQQTNDDFQYSFRNPFDSTQNYGLKKGIKDVLSILVKEGYRYNIYLILGLKGDPSLWRNIRPTDVNNVVLFNTTQYSSQVDNQFFVREMLRNISPETGDETMAVCISEKHISKLRPLIYDMSVKSEVERINDLLEV